MRTKPFFPVCLISFLCLLSCQTDEKGKVAEPKQPQSLLEEATFSLVSKEPDIVTPTGVAVDDHNNIWVIENHTHVRQEDYPGPKADRILVFSGYLTEKEPKKITEFASNFIDGMSLSLSREGKVLVTTRASILAFEDADGDLVADTKDTIIRLETSERFPHNGMSGMVISPDNKIYFQCGENFGASYVLTGTDGKDILGKEREGGSIFRCNIDGSNVEKISTAVWNCFAMTFDAYGNLFAVENDPDSRPPCRLLHIVKGGNYGFQFQHGRDGLSPLTSWFGQIPGTLPMVAGTGEAPSGVLHYEGNRLGPDLKEALLVTAWGDNEIQSFQLAQKGSSFTAEPLSVVKGERNFYPVGLALDNQGSVIATDWASFSYAVHGQGRIWRIASAGKEPVPFPFSEKIPDEELVSTLAHPNPKVREKAAGQVMNQTKETQLDLFRKVGDKGKMNLIYAAQRTKSSLLTQFLEEGLENGNELLRGAIVRIMVDLGNQEEVFFLDIIQKETAPFVQREAIYGLKSKAAFQQVVTLFQKNDPFIHSALINTFGKAANLDLLLNYARDADEKIRLGALLCLRHTGLEEAQAVIPRFLSDPGQDNRITVLKWIAEENLKSYRPEVESSFSLASDLSPELFDTYIVTFQYLDGTFNQKNHFMEGDEHVSQTFYKRQKFLLAAAQNEKLNYGIRKRALSGLNPMGKDLDFATLKAFSQASDEGFRIEAIRSLGSRVEDKEAISYLQSLIKDGSLSPSLTLEAIVGLANSIKETPTTRDILLELAGDAQTSDKIREEAIRSLGFIATDAAVAPMLTAYKKTQINTEAGNSLDYWRAEGNKKGNARAGARIFFHPRYQCGNCHRIDGRGGIFGPDLSQVGGNTDRDRIIESILQPSEIVTPAYAGYTIVDSDGKTLIGRLDRELDSKRHLQLITPEGKRDRVAFDAISEQSIMENSLMPANLHLLMTGAEFRDMVQFLAERK